MDRPISILKFERCYLGALFVGAVNLLLTWEDIVAQPAVRRAAALIGDWYLPTATAIGFVVPLILWFFVARRASVVAKWIVTVFFAFSVIGVVFNVLTGSFVSSLSAVLGVSALVLNGVALAMLFRPDAQIWFGDAPDLPIEPRS